MRIECEKKSNYTLARMTGSLELSQAPRLSEALCLNSMADNIVLDMSGVDFMDSAGLGSLMQVLRGFAESDRRIVIANPSPIVGRTLHLMGVDRIVPIMDTLKSAVGALSS